MKEQGYIYLPSEFEDASVDDLSVDFYRWSDITRNITKVVADISLSQLAEQLNDHPVDKLTAVLPANNLNVLEIEVPTGNARVLKQALPYLVEEQCVQEPDQLTLVTDYKAKNNRLNVVAIDNGLIERITDTFSSFGLQLHQLFGIEQLLPELSQQLLVLADQHKLYFQGNHKPPVVLPVNQAKWFISRLDISAYTEGFKESDTDLLNVKLVIEEGSSLTEPALKELLATTFTEQPFEVYPEVTADMQHYLCKMSAANQAKKQLNLLTGAFRPPQKQNQYLKLFTPVIAFGMIVLSVQLSLSLYSGWQYKTKADAVQQQVVDTIKKHLPNTRFDRLRGDSALRSHIKNAINRGSTESESLELTKVAEDLISGLESFNVASRPYVQRVAYRASAGDTQLELHAKSFGEVDQLKNHLDQKGYQVTVGSVTNDNGLFKGRLTLRAKDS